MAADASTQNFGQADVLSRLISNHPKVNEDMVIASIQVIDEDIHYLQDEICSKLPITFNMVRLATNHCKVLKHVKMGNFART